MNFCGINISCFSHDSLLQFSSDPQILVTVNAEAIVRAQKDLRLKRIINENIASIDGQIPLWLFKKKYPDFPIEKISGADLIYTIPKFAEINNLKIFFLGGDEASNRGAVMNLKSKFLKLRIDGFSFPFCPYPFPDKINTEIECRLRTFKPDIIFVGLGMGKQEYWEEDNKSLFKEIGTKLVIGCGGSLDFASGKIKRAPQFIQKIGLESFWRLFIEFKWFRIKRIFLSCKIFFIKR